MKKSPGFFLKALILLIIFALFSCGPFSSDGAFAIEIFGARYFEDGKIIAEANPEQGAVHYDVKFDVPSGDSDLKKILENASSLYANRKTGVAGLPALVGLARADQDRLNAALYSEAYYGGSIHIRLNNQPLNEFTFSEEQSAKGKPLSVSVKIQPGPKFTFGEITIRQPVYDGAPQHQVYDPQSSGLIRGRPAKSTIVIEAVDGLIANWKMAGYPHARLVSKDVVADHAIHELNVTLDIDPGPKAVFGAVTVDGTQMLDAAMVREQTAIEKGAVYTPTALKIARNRLRKVEGIESFRIREGETVDETGAIPIFVEVTERKPRYFGATTSWSTIDGAEVQAYWGHRNVFGEGELLRIEGSIAQIGSDDFEEYEDIEYSLGLSFLKPGFFDIDTDLIFETRFLREHPDTYDSKTTNAKIGISHRFNEVLEGNISLSGDYSTIEDAFGETDYWLLSVPGNLIYDNRDDRLDPISGLRATLQFIPVADFENDFQFLLSQGSLAAYHSLDSEKRSVIAGRLAAGVIAGADLEDIPATYRFFSGGGGSVRGYPYRSIGPLVNGIVAGGRSFLDASAELRMRVTETVGIVPFVDMGTVSEDEFFDLDEDIRVGAGVGLRYYTVIGPLRFDFAVPLDPQRGDPEFAFYVGLGQAY